jgi:hypothetical protein
MSYAKANSFSSAGLSSGLNDDNLYIGNAGNVAQAVDTSSVGEILADHANGLTIKAGVIVDADINASAAIAYSKLNLTGGILDADINASAAIDATKLGNADVDNTELSYLNGVTSAIQTQLDAKLDDVATANDNEIPRFNTNGQALQNSGITIDDSNNLAGVAALTLSGNIDQASAVALNIGTTTATTINISRSGQTTIIKGDFQVDGTTTTVNSTTLDVADVNITVNDGGNQASANGSSGLTVEMSDATDVRMIYDSTLPTRWKAGDSGAEIELLGAGVDATKLGNGDVDDTELSYLNGVTSAIQTQLDAKLDDFSSTTDNALVRTNGTAGEAIQDSGITIDDSDNVSGFKATRIANEFRRTITTYSSVQTLSATVDDVVLVSGNTTLNLPAAASNSGVEFVIKKTDSNSTTVTIDPNAAELIDGAATYTVLEQNTSITIVCDGTGWKII